MDEATTRVTVDKQVRGHWRVTLNHPPINTIDDLMYDEVFDLVQAIEAEPGLKVVTFESADPDYFLAHYGVGESQSRFGAPRWRDDMRPGDSVSGFSGWQDYAVVDDETNEMPLTVLPSPLPAPITTLLGPLGHTGITAYLGIEDIADLKAGETMVVSAAAGAVGSIAGQVGKARGARVVGLAGSEEKCRHVVDELGFDACVNYKAADWRDQLDAATPDGVDVDFENVGGEIMDHVLGRLNIGARIVLSGMLSEYNSYGPGSVVAGQREIGQLIMQRAVMRGFLVLDHADRFPEAIGYLAGLLAEGKLKYDETIVDGLENARDALNDLFAGSNVGKLLIKVG